jgi:hypothetical protein
MSIMGLLWMRQPSSHIRKRRVIHSNSARHGLLFWERWHSHTDVDEDCALLTGEGLRTFRLNTVPSSWTVGPEDEGKLTSPQGETSQMTCNFNATVRISSPTVVPKRRQEATNRLCVQPQKSTDLIYTAFEAWNDATVNCVTFSAISMPRECTDCWQGVFYVMMCMLVT